MIPFGVPKYYRCRTIMGIQKGTIILTTTQMHTLLNQTEKLTLPEKGNLGMGSLNPKPFKQTVVHHPSVQPCVKGLQKPKGNPKP